MEGRLMGVVLAPSRKKVPVAKPAPKKEPEKSGQESA
jgi:hypothetical protein